MSEQSNVGSWHIFGVEAGGRVMHWINGDGGTGQTAIGMVTRSPLNASYGT